MYSMILLSGSNRATELPLDVVVGGQQHRLERDQPHQL
jgi:hypothetical protein